MLNLLMKDYKELFSNKKRIGIIVVVLVILIISTYYDLTKQVNDRPTTMIQFGIVDKDSSAYSKLLLEYFNESESFSSYINIVEGKSEEIEKSFNEGKLDLYLVIPEDFAKNMIYLNHLPVRVVINSADTTKAILLKNILESYEKYISAVETNCVTLYDVMTLSKMDSNLVEVKNIEISYDLIFTALGKEKFFHYQEIGVFPQTTMLNYYICVMISIILIYSGLYVGFQMMKEKKLGTLRRLYTVGMTTANILLEKIIFSSVIIFLIIYSANFIPSLYKGEPIDIKVGIIYLCAAIFSVSFAILLSGIFSNIQNYMIVGNFLSFIFIIIGGGIIPIMYLPAELVKVSKYTPIYWFIKLILTTQRGIKDELFLIIILVLLSSALLFYILSKIAYGREGVRLED